MTQLLPLKSTTVSWFTLFYDLVVVAAFSETAHVYAKSPTWSSLLYIALVILTLYIQWGLTTFEFLVDQRDTWPRRIAVLVQMCAILFAAVSLGHGTTLQDDWGFMALSISFIASGVLTLMRNRDFDDFRGLRVGLASALFGSAAIYVWGSTLDVHTMVGPFQAVYIVFLLGLLISAIAGLFWIPRLMVHEAAVDSDQMEERFGLLFLIVLGESFLLLVSSLADKGQIPSFLFFVLTVAAVFTLWVQYFPTLAGNLGPETTALPFLGALASILWLTLIRDGKWTGIATVHTVGLGMLLVVSTIGVFSDRVTSGWLLVGALVVLFVDAIISIQLFKKRPVPAEIAA